MRFALATIIMALPLAICAPTNTQIITVLYRWEKEANEHGIAAFGEFDTLIGHSCSKVLNTGSFATAPISFNLTKDNGAGFITVDGSEHMIHTNSQYSNGPTCTRVYNQAMVELDCQVTLPSGFQGVPLSANEVSCFQRLAKGIRVLNTALVNDPKYAANDADFGMKEPKHNAITSRSNDLVDRQCVVSYATEPQAEKDPWQRFLGKQLTVSMSVF
ncbi:hypothetical protein N7474_002283 [Penicillium riverlandense]|uniref:uncharacterized protein n=1 Tax=Penicillium riverlandense TaxID=1903569 RepID=UPI0025493CCD|nr:uncharacterized protein N7474_002283 [Penicillium riverlandense]KAJ5833972.1 hypothetical protein N7474_002283 [Penicillium riverlandense]